jgi:hypothetical protein
MLHVLLQIAACMLLISSAAQEGGYRNGRIRPVRDPAILSHEFQPVEPLPHEQLEQVDNTICLRITASRPHYGVVKIIKLEDAMLSIPS